MDRRLPTALLAAALSACVSTFPRHGVAEELVAADRAFAADTTNRGLQGWLSWFAADAVKLSGGPQVVRGLAGIADADRDLFARDDLQLVWEPVEAGPFEGGDLGYTAGRYEVVQRSADGGLDVVARGTYVSLWRRDGGKWRVIADVGIPEEGRRR